jgi:hypothetical protein
MYSFKYRSFITAMQLTPIGFAMVINPVSTSSATVTATQAIRPQQEVAEVRQAPSSTSSDNDSDNAVQAAQASAPKPTVNTSGQTVGTLVNVTA